MSLPSPSLKTCLVAIVALAAAMTGLALASSERDRVAGSSSAAPRLALGKAEEAATSRRVQGVIGRAKATIRERKPGNGAEAPAATPELVTGAAATEPAAPAVPASPPASAPGAEAPAPTEPPVATDPPAEPAAPEPPAEPPAPEPPAPEPPAPSPDPDPPAEPPPSPPAQPSNPDIDPGIPVPPATAGPFVVGIDGGYAGWVPSEVKQRAALGAAVTRHEWHISNPVTSEEEQMIAAATEIDTRVLALLGGNDHGDAAAYRDWVVAFVRHYGVGGTFWAQHPGLDESRYAITTIELGNEPYFGAMTAEAYADTVRPTLEKVKELDLPVKVLLPVWLHGANISWLDTLYERIPNLNSLYHGLAFHPYWYGHDPETPGDSGPIERIVDLRARMNALGATAKPIYLTEYGESTANCGSECVSEAEQADHLAKMIDAIVAHPEWKIALLSVFQLLDRGTGSSDRELQFGLLREDGTPKPAYAIVRTAMQQYR
jgi:outer membrane biosynthesis protein TonB